MRPALMCFDLDGVLCEDPPEGCRPGTQEYLKYIENARPILLPAMPIEKIITGRTEEYRKITEDWLARHFVGYEELVMKPSSLSGVENTPGFKAEEYKNSISQCFVESEPWQAEKIAELSGKEVYCIANEKTYTKKV